MSRGNVESHWGPALKVESYVAEAKASRYSIPKPTPPAASLFTFFAKPMFTLNNISVHFSGDYLFRDLSLLITPQDRIGLTGRNGAGKTTLLRILKGEMLPEKGEVAIPRGKTIGYLPQQMETLGKGSVVEEARKAFQEVLNLGVRIETLNRAITSRNDYDSPDYHRLIEDLAQSNERYQMLGGHTMDVDIEKTLTGLGFQRNELHQPIRTFSGGWQMRVELAKILLSHPDLLLLDEPTNHLDIESIQWLEGFLESYPGAVILVSHDRAFLDNVTRRTIELSGGRVYDYKASYSGYLEMRESLMEQQMATWSNQQREIAQIERFIERFRYKNTKARQVQSRIKQLEKMDVVEPDLPDGAAIHFRFPPAPRSGKVVFEARQLGKNYGEKQVLKKLDISILRGEKIAFVGKNGEGKTTLSRIIVGELDHTGEAEKGYQVQIGYFAQNQAELLDGDKSVFETIDAVATGEMRTRVRSLLGNFLFSGEDIEKKVKVLSGGEKSRLALCRMLLFPVNLLVLDEPTNHLDMRSKDILKSALLQYDGSLIIVSHDRDFLQGLTDKVYEFRNQGIREYIGDVYDFLEARRLDHLRDLESASKSAKKDTPGNARPSGNKMDYQDRKAFEKRLRKTRSQLEQTESQIHQYEKEMEEIKRKLSRPEEHRQEIEGKDLFSRYDDLQKEMEKRMLDWESLSAEVEQMEKERNTG